MFAPVSEADAEATIERAWSLGVRFFDTAPLYGFGLAERRLGDFLRRQERDSFAISTKVGRLLRPASAAAEDGYYKGTPAERPQFDFSYDGVMRSVEESLARLGLDRVDVLLVHDPEPDAYLSWTVTDARTEPDLPTDPLNFTRLGCVTTPSFMFTEKL